MFASKQCIAIVVMLMSHGVALAHGAPFEHNHLLHSAPEILLFLLVFSGVVGAIFMPDTREKISK